MFRIRQFLLNAEGDAGSGGDGGGEGAASTPVAAEPFSGTPNWGLPNQGQAPVTTPTPEIPIVPNVPVTPTPAAPEVLDFAGRKIPVVDPSIKDLHKDFTTLSSTYTKTNQELVELRAQAEVYKQMVETFQKQPPVAPQVPQVTEPTPEQLEQEKENFMTRFYEDPLAAISELVTKNVTPIVEPINRDREAQEKDKAFNDEVQRVSGKYSDFNDLVPQMAAVLEANPELNKQGLETVYMYAKANAATAQAPAPTPEQLLQDPQFVQQIMSNPQITSQIVSQYVNQKAATNQQIPVVLGNQAGGSIPSMPTNTPTTLSEASKAFAKYLGL